MAKTRSHHRNNRLRTQRKRGGGGKKWLKWWPSCIGAICTTDVVNSSAHKTVNAVTSFNAAPAAAPENVHVNAIGEGWAVAAQPSMNAAAPNLVGPITQVTSTINPIDSILFYARQIQEKYNSARTRKAKQNLNGARLHIKNTFVVKKLILSNLSKTKYEPKYKPILNKLKTELDKSLVEFDIIKFNIIVKALNTMKNETDPVKIETIHLIMENELTNHALSKSWDELSNSGVSVELKNNFNEFNELIFGSKDASVSHGNGNPPAVLALFGKQKKQNEHSSLPGVVGGIRRHRSNKKLTRRRR